MDKDERIALLNIKLDQLQEMYVVEREKARGAETRLLELKQQSLPLPSSGTTYQDHEINSLRSKLQETSTSLTGISAERDQLAALNISLTKQVRLLSSAQQLPEHQILPTYTVEERANHLEQIEDLKRQVAINAEWQRIDSQGRSSRLEVLEGFYNELQRENKQLYLLYSQSVTENQSLKQKVHELTRKVSSASVDANPSVPASQTDQSVLQTLAETQTKLARVKGKKQFLSSENAGLSSEVSRLEGELSRVQQEFSQRLLQVQADHFATLSARESEIRNHCQNEVSALRHELTQLQASNEADSHRQEFDLLRAQYGQMTSRIVLLNQLDAFSICTPPACILELNERLQMQGEDWKQTIARLVEERGQLTTQTAQIEVDTPPSEYERQTIKVESTEDIIQQRVEEELSRLKQSPSSSNSSSTVNKLLAVIHKSLHP